MTSQHQRGGAGSQQIQVAGDLVLGVTEERAVQIAREQADLAIREFTAEANAVARERMDNLDQKVVHELSGRGLLSNFSDPAFQILLRKAQLQAAATSSDEDHEVLAKLLAERAQRPTKPMHLIVTRSVEVIEYLDEEALAGITLLFLVYGLLPGSPDPKAGLGQIEELAASLQFDSFPAGANWLNRLDLLSPLSAQPFAGQLGYYSVSKQAGICM